MLFQLKRKIRNAFIIAECLSTSYNCRQEGVGKKNVRLHLH